MQSRSPSATPRRPRRHAEGGVRRDRHLDPARRGRRPAHVLRAVRAAAPRPGGRRHRRQRRPAGPGPQAARARVARLHERHAQAAHRLPLDRPHPVLDDRVVERAQHPAVPRRDDARPARPRPQRQHRQHAGAARRAAGPRLRAHRDQRLRGDDADARGRRRQDVGGAHRAHAAGVEGRVLARPARRRPRRSRCATRGASGRCRSAASPTAATPSPARRAPCRRSAASRSARSSRARSSRCAAPSCTAARRSPRPSDQARCTFEFVYFSRPDSVWNGRNVHHARERLGAELAAESPVDADVVIPVPDSSIPAAIGYARASGVPFNDGLIKNRYIGRTFIEPTQEIRDRGVALKFNALSREPRRQAGGHDRRLARARHDGRAARQADPRRRGHRGPRAHHVPADHAPVPLRRRHGPRRRPDGGPPDAATRSASASAPTASSSCRSKG